MKRYLCFFFLLYSLIAVGQKPVLDTGVFRTWASNGSIASMTANGDYMSYRIYDQPPGSQKLVIRASYSPWKKEISGASMTFFSKDSRFAVFKTGKDSLWILTLGLDNLTCIQHCSEFNLSDDQGNWLTYRLKSNPEDLVLRDLSDGKEQHLASIIRYQFTNLGKAILLTAKTGNSDKSETRLQWFSLETKEIKDIWAGSANIQPAGNCAVSADDKELAFVVIHSRDSLSGYELWYYKKGMDNAIRLVDNKNPGIDAGLELDGQLPIFSKDGSELFFGLKKRSETRKPLSESVKLDIWSYRDRELQSIQLANPTQDEFFSAVIDISDKHIVRLEQSEETSVGHTNDFVLIHHQPGYYSDFESYWNISAQSSFWLVSTHDGFRKLIKDHVANPAEGVGITPAGKWLVYFDYKQKNFFSYELATGITRNVTKGIQTNWIDQSNDRPDYKLNWVPWRRTWLKDDEAALIYDNYDIWEVDPKGIDPPLNLTNGFGRRHHIKFSLAAEGSDLQELSIREKPTLVLQAVDDKTKNRGFYTKKLGEAGDPEVGIMGPYVFGDWEGYNSFNYPPLKAKDANVWLLTRMSAVESPNYFITRDFRSFTTLTDVQPQKVYNWMTTELIHWKTFNGSFSDGILYKPEDFNPKERYPVIFDYYERRSDELNLYVWPKASENRINVAWYVSHGYLVCSPDIHYKQGEPGQSAYNSIVSAAVYLSKMPWVDAKRMGIQGHSFGGYETNYIITHTKLFAAACSASGVSDLISFYGSIPRAGDPRFASERQQERMAATPWQTPKQYILNSPIFLANRITTPLLMMNNKQDGQVPFAQGVEFFTALRRLGKRVWMMQYDEGGHSVGRGKDALDYSIRMAQFFDHYLKGAPAPKWMTRGIPARLKGIDNGLELDHEIKTPGPGLEVSEESDKR